MSILYSHVLTLERPSNRSMLSITQRCPARPLRRSLGSAHIASSLSRANRVSNLEQLDEHRVVTGAQTGNDPPIIRRGPDEWFEVAHPRGNSAQQLSGSDQLGNGPRPERATGRVVGGITISRFRDRSEPDSLRCNSNPRNTAPTGRPDRKLASTYDPINHGDTVPWW